MKHFPFFFLLCSLLCSCLSEEGYTSSADAQLRLERDTLALDTVLAGEPTNTYTFQVFNPHRKTLRIAGVRLALGAASPFSVNVDGSFLPNGVGEATEVAGGDSLRVFVQLNAPASDAVSPTALEDRLVFRLESGVEQQVLLTASTQSVINLRAHRVESDITWSDRRPYRILDSLVVAEGSTLTLSAGTRLYFHPEARLIVHGTLRAEGQNGVPVELRGDRLGYMFSNQPYDRIPGQWGGVVFSDKSHDNVLEYCEIHSGDFGIRCDSSSIDVQKLTLSNSLIHNVGGHGLYARQCALTVGNTQITNAAGDCVRLIGGRSEFTHCTIGHFMLWPVTAVSRCISAIMVRVAVLRLSARRLSTASSADTTTMISWASLLRVIRTMRSTMISRIVCSIRPNRPSTNTSVTACLRRIHPKSTAKPEISTRVLICRSCCLPLHLTPNQRLSVQQILQ